MCKYIGLVWSLVRAVDGSIIFTGLFLLLLHLVPDARMTTLRAQGWCSGNGVTKATGNRTRNVSVWHRCPHPEPSSPTRRYFAKNEVEKRAITLIIIGRFYPKLNLTIFYDYIPGYKIWIQYTNQSFLKKYWKENIFWSWKSAITPIIMG